MPVSPVAVSHLSRVSPASAAIRLVILGAAALISIPLSAAQNSASPPTEASVSVIDCNRLAICTQEHP